MTRLIDKGPGLKSVTAVGLMVAFVSASASMSYASPSTSNAPFESFVSLESEASGCFEEQGVDIHGRLEVAADVSTQEIVFRPLTVARDGGASLLESIDPDRPERAQFALDTCLRRLREHMGFEAEPPEQELPALDAARATVASRCLDEEGISRQLEVVDFLEVNGHPAIEVVTIEGLTDSETDALVGRLRECTLVAADPARD